MRIPQRAKRYGPKLLKLGSEIASWIAYDQTGVLEGYDEGAGLGQLGRVTRCEGQGIGRARAEGYGVGEGAGGVGYAAGLTDKVKGATFARLCQLMDTERMRDTMGQRRDLRNAIRIVRRDGIILSFEVPSHIP